MNIEIEKGMLLVATTILGVNFQKFVCDKFFPTQKLPGDR